MKIYVLTVFMLLVFSSCTAEDPVNTCITALDCEEGEICRNGECVQGEIGDTGDTGNSGDSGDTGDSGNTGNTGNSGNTGDSGDTVDDKDEVDSDNSDDSDASDQYDQSEQSDQNDDSDIDNVPVCGNEALENGEDCDSGEANVEPGYSDTQVCSTDCVWNPYCGDAAIDYKQAVFTEDAVVLRLDGDSLTEASDSSVNALTATVENATRVEGKFGNALNFTGTCVYDGTDWNCENDGRVYWTYDTVPTNNFTMMAWVKAVDEHEIDEQSNTGTVGTKGQRYVFGANHGGADSGGAGVSVGTNGISVYEHGDGYMPALAVYKVGLGTDWNHIAVVYTDRQPSIYLNGTLVKTGVVSARATVNAPTSVGAGNYGNFNGTVDEIRVTAKALTEVEIREAMGEVCDEGASNAEVLYGSAVCNTDCMINAHCGDGVVSNGETCDEGTYNGTAGKCKADCSGYDCIPGVYTFTYTGAVQTFDVQYPGTYTIEAWGGQGRSNQMGNVAGGLGGYSKATIPLTVGDKLNIYVGEGGGSGVTACWNGGGAGGTTGCTNAQGGAGGGASDVRKNGTNLTDRIIVAGGGGGAGGNRIKSCGPGAGGGGGGGYFGGGGGGAYQPTSVATGGTQSAGGIGGIGQFGGDNGAVGTIGVGGKGGNAPNSGQGDSNTALAGGAGGGSTGSNGINAGNWTGGSGAGGSGFVNASGNTNTSTSNNVRTGNGEVKITLTCP